MSKPLAVFVPAGDALFDIDRGSGIVGEDTGDMAGKLPTGEVEIDFEGNRFGAENIRTYADRVWVAAARHVGRTPTVARMVVPDEALIYVGDFHDGRIDVDPVNFRVLAEWLGSEDSLFDPRELLTSNFRPQNTP